MLISSGLDRHFILLRTRATTGIQAADAIHAKLKAEGYKVIGVKVRTTHIKGWWEGCAEINGLPQPNNHPFT